MLFVCRETLTLCVGKVLDFKQYRLLYKLARTPRQPAGGMNRGCGVAKSVSRRCKANSGDERTRIRAVDAPQLAGGGVIP